MTTLLRSKKIELANNLLRIEVLKYLNDNWVLLGDKITTNIGHLDNLEDREIAGHVLAEMFKKL